MSKRWLVQGAIIVPAQVHLQRAFVTGATGFVGANLARRLLQCGFQVRALVRRNSDRSSLVGLPLELVEGDLLDTASVSAGLKGCDVCFHVAAAISSEDAPALYRTNVDGSFAVLRAASEAGVKSIVHTSTVGTLSRSDGAPAREADRRIGPGASDYVKSKHEAEKIALDLAVKGAPIRIVHPSAPVGPWDRVPTVTGHRIRKVLAGRVPRWIAGVINHVYVGDVVEGMILAATRGAAGESYLLANRDGNLSLESFVRLVAAAAGTAPPRTRRRLAFLKWFRPRPQPKFDAAVGPTSLAYDPTWTIERLGLPQTPLEVAFREAVEWFRLHPSVPASSS